MAVPEAVWCVVCGAVPDVALTIERNEVLAHYGACWAHVGEVTARARRETTPPGASQWVVMRAIEEGADE